MNEFTKDDETTPMLRACIRDLAALSALPSLWANREPRRSSRNSSISCRRRYGSTSRTRGSRTHAARHGRRRAGPALGPRVPRTRVHEIAGMLGPLSGRTPRATDGDEPARRRGPARRRAALADGRGRDLRVLAAPRLPDVARVDGARARRSIRSRSGCGSPGSSPTRGASRPSSPSARAATCSSRTRTPTSARRSRSPSPSAASSARARRCETSSRRSSSSRRPRRPCSSSASRAPARSCSRARSTSAAAAPAGRSSR